MSAMPNKPGEPPFQLKLEPDVALLFRGRLKDEPVIIDLKITNSSQQRQTFKIKCTDNEMFRVQPPLGFLRPGEVLVIKVAFMPRPGREHGKQYFAIYHMKTDEDKKTAREEARPEGVKRMAAVFEDIGAPKSSPTEEKKSIEKARSLEAK